MSYKINKKKVKEFIKYALSTGFNDEESAEDHLKNIIETFNDLPDPVRLYRILFLKNIRDFNKEEPGEHYVLSKEKLIRDHYDSMLYDYSQFEKSRPYILIVEANKNKIDFTETIKNNLAYPHEEEITLKDKGRGVNILSLVKLKR